MLPTSFRSRLRALIEMEDRLRVERGIAFSRLLVAFAALFALQLNPSRVTGYAPETFVLLSLYGLGAVVLYLKLRKMSRLPQGLPLATHVVDIAITATLTVWTDGSSDPFFTFIICVVMAAAYRWGFYETLATTAAAAALVALEAFHFRNAPGISAGIIDGQFDANGFTMRVVYLGIVGLFLGYLGEQQQQRRRESAAIATLGRDAWVSAGMQGLLESTLGMVLKLYGASRAVVFIDDPRSAHATVWNCRLSPDSDGLLISSEVAEDSMTAPHFASSGDGWYAAARRAGKHVEAITLDRTGRRLPITTSPLAASFVAAYKCRSVLSVPVHFQQTVNGRVFLIEPHVGFDRENAVRIAQRFAREIGPAARNVYRLRRLRSRTEAVERGRIARDLHDGLLQVLTAVELRVDIVRRKLTNVSADEAAELSRIQTLITEEARSVRLLTRRMQLPFATTEGLQTTFSEVVTRFGRETGIAARFAADNDARVAPRVRYELLRILQEGLVNVRKHSGARHVNVRLAEEHGMLRLLIEDDGRGFPFAGRRTQTQLEAARLGPLTIRERVRALRGELNVESIPGRGSCLDVKVPITQ